TGGRWLDNATCENTLAVPRPDGDMLPRKLGPLRHNSAQWKRDSAICACRFRGAKPVRTSSFFRGLQEPSCLLRSERPTLPISPPSRKQHFVATAFPAVPSAP